MSEKFRVNLFFNGVSTFKAAFPDVHDAVVEWREKRGPEDDKPGELRKTGFRRGNFTQGVMACSNPMCHEGGYQLDRLIADMLSQGDTERRGLMLCSGREVAEEVRRGPVRCPHRIEYHSTVSLKSAAEQIAEPEQPRNNNRRRGRGRGPRRRSFA